MTMNHSSALQNLNNPPGEAEIQEIPKDYGIVLPYFENREEGRIIEFMYDLATDYVYYSTMITVIENYYSKITSVCTHMKIEYNNIKREMTNYNYDTDFSINRRTLYTLINKLNKMNKIPFFAQYWSQVHTHVTVFLPIDSDIIRPRGKKRKSIIMIYRNGRVTCSVSNPNEGERFYIMFSKVIMFLENFIRIPEIRSYSIS